MATATPLWNCGASAERWKSQKSEQAVIGRLFFWNCLVDLTAQNRPGCLADILDNPLRQCLELILGKCLVLRLDGDLDGDRLAAFADACALKQVISFLSAPCAAFRIAPAATPLSTMKAKSRFNAWNGDRSSRGLVRTARAFGSDRASR
jgi:hypothetical protein